MIEVDFHPKRKISLSSLIFLHIGFSSLKFKQAWQSVFSPGCLVSLSVHFSTFSISSVLWPWIVFILVPVLLSTLRVVCAAWTCVLILEENVGVRFCLNIYYHFNVKNNFLLTFLLHITFTYPVLVFIWERTFNTPVPKYVRNRHGQSKANICFTFQSEYVPFY